jgi:hypothetical protein
LNELNASLKRANAFLIRQEMITFLWSMNNHSFIIPKTKGLVEVAPQHPTKSTRYSRRMSQTLEPQCQYAEKPVPKTAAHRETEKNHPSVTEISRLRIRLW